MIICITGATGFIGQKLVEKHLARGDQVRILSRHLAPDIHQSVSFKRFTGDLTDQSSLLNFVEGADVLYNCAGEIRNESRMDALHVQGVSRLAQVASGRVRHWVQLSSVGVYGTVADGQVTENSKVNPVGKYEVTKESSDQIVIDMANKGGFSYSILRPSNVYGARMTNKSLFNMIAMIDRGLFFYIGKVGASANYIHVDNVVEGLMICASHPSARGRIYNLSDHRVLEGFVDVISTTLNRSPPLCRLPYSVAYIIASTLGKLPNFPLTQSRVKALINRSSYPTTLIQRELGYQHIVSMEEGLRELVQVYKQRLVTIEPQ